MASGSGSLRTLGLPVLCFRLNGGNRKVRQEGGWWLPPSTLCSTLEITAQRALPITYLGTSSPVKIKPPGPSASSKRPRSPCRCPLPLLPPHFRPFSAHHVQSLWLGFSSRFIRPGLRESNRWKANILVIQSQSVGTLLILLSTFSQFVLLL